MGPDEDHTGLTHEMPCPACHHGWHHFIPCECGCELPPAPGLD